jgi:hypothetical protein
LFGKPLSASIDPAHRNHLALPDAENLACALVFTDRLQLCFDR